MSKGNISDIRDSLGFIPMPGKRIGYTGVFTTGNFEAIFDYDAGLLKVGISITPCMERGSKNWHPIVSISTIDDGVWQAIHVLNFTMQECIDQIEKIHKEWLWKYKLPTEKELNFFLMRYGLFGEYTG
jgi:hypothetical protein